ncbi:hypothetical protein [Alkalicoccobacillus murimartini]|uniref:DNA repair exonuclease SbcCD ATPase subunit n=1 Tax=Alkalicoccobacillus murimartini TaxID=171685 RepID=A0ABT9YGG5_9BACI|nr:hypothetical protein [Alkalicoccobacillus murimartini]MDQ0206950.1 DNA repair exonuclease SbcCD ATPase subunit [Alkalicoccobacillus murimartini]
MDNSQQIFLLNQRITSKQSSISTLSGQNNTYRSQHSDGISELNRLEKQLEDLLQNQQDMINQLDKIEGLTVGEGSPMGRIKFFAPGLLEGRALEKIQERIANRQDQQLQGRNRIQETIHEADDDISELEGKIEDQKAANLQLEQLLSNNQNRIDQLKLQVSSDRSRLRMM